MDKIRKEIIFRKYKERLFRQNPTDYILNAFYQQRQHISNIIKTSKKIYYIDKLRENRNDFKMVFQMANKLLPRNETPPLPPTDDKKLLADQFNEFFMMKIDKIMDSLVPSDTHPINEKYIEKDFLTSLCLTNLRPIMLQETIDLSKSAAPKSCELDPIPKSIILKYVEIIAPTIQEIINLSMTTGIMPENMKEAILQPLLKKLKSGSSTI